MAACCDIVTDTFVSPGVFAIAIRMHGGVSRVNQPPYNASCGFIAGGRSVARPDRFSISAAPAVERHPAMTGQNGVRVELDKMQPFKMFEDVLERVRDFAEETGGAIGHAAGGVADRVHGPAGR